MNKRILLTLIFGIFLILGVTAGNISFSSITKERIDNSTFTATDLKDAPVIIDMKDEPIYGDIDNLIEDIFYKLGKKGIDVKDLKNMEVTFAEGTMTLYCSKIVLGICSFNQSKMLYEESAQTCYNNGKFWDWEKDICEVEEDWMQYDVVTENFPEKEPGFARI